MVLVLGLAFAGWLGTWVDRWVVRSPWLDLLLLIPVIVVAFDVVNQASRPFSEAFWMEAPDSIEAATPFEHRTRAPVAYKRPDWAAPILLSMMANTGVIECYGLDPGFQHNIGAIGADKSNYPGRAYVSDGEGKAEVADWSPNHVVIRVEGAKPDATVVYNMNWDPSWRSNGATALNVSNAIGSRLRSGQNRIEFHYVPRTLKWSLPIFLLTVACLGTIFWRRLRSGAIQRKASTHDA
jgi:hypothetical protein